MSRRAIFQRLLGYLKEQRLSLFLCMLSAVISTAFLVLAPFLVGRVTTALFASIADGVFYWDTILCLLAALVALYLISQLFTFLQGFGMARITAHVMQKLRSDIDGKMHRLKLDYYDTHTHGDILSVITNDVDTINNAISQNLTSVVTQITTAVGVLVMMLAISPALTVIPVVMVPLSLLSAAGMMKASETYYGQQQDLLGALNGYVEEMYNGQQVVQAFNHQKQAKAEFRALNEALRDSARKAEVTAGSVSPITTLVNGGRIFALLDAEEEVPDPQSPAVPREHSGRVVFHQVQFGYTPDRLLMKGVDLAVEPGQKVAIVGPTGAGKTTLINLLMRFYELSGGSIQVDGVDIRQMSRAELRDRFGMVLQDTWLFEGAIADNIAYGEPDMDREKVIASARSACAHSFIKTLPGGYDMVLSKGAENISQGERQLITIARAIASDPEILILDEATSNVDVHTEVLIQKAMAELMKGRTSFVIAHRLSTIRDADMILYMEDGDIQEMGGHEELLARQGRYAALYHSQFG